ncbi:jg2434, partial [Pararge aegeria aegeria]
RRARPPRRPRSSCVSRRNVTCYWSLRQKDIPTCKHAMLSVRQQFAHKMQIKRSIAMASKPSIMILLRRLLNVISVNNGQRKSNAASHKMAAALPSWCRASCSQYSAACCRVIN